MAAGNSFTLHIYNSVLHILRLCMLPLSARFREREKGAAAMQFKSAPAGHIHYWFHAASLGEFEQARPIIEYIRKHKPDAWISVSFFSPSGYRVRHAYPQADQVFYIPLDTKEKADQLVQQLQPDHAIFVRYELWPNLLHMLRHANIPVYSINATFPRSALWKYAPNILRSILMQYTVLFTVSEAETRLFESLIPDHPGIISGSDTRLDRIAGIVKQMQDKDDPDYKSIIPSNILQSGIPTIVLGSVWPADIELFAAALSAIQQQVNLIIVPHQPDEHYVRHAQAMFPGALCLSRLQPGMRSKYIIADGIGYLLRLYSVADAAYVGGGFGAGVHSVAEPAGYGIPLACGPFTHRSPDAVILEHMAALRVIKDVPAIIAWLNDICQGKKEMAEAGKAAARYVHESLGMSARIAEYIMQNQAV
jgi:3-deoxy-D-manno-octulosonic-acid transferase